MNTRATLGIIGALVICLAGTSWARDLEYQDTEVDIRVAPSEPTQLQFPGKIAGGFKKKLSTLSLDRKDSDLVIFANEGISDKGEAIIIRLEDGRSYSIRVKRATDDTPRDDFVRINDERGSLVVSSEEEEPAYKDRQFQYAPPSQISGLMREMMLAAEFGKTQIAGYRISERYKGDVVLSDGAVLATIDKIFIGPNLWGYVIDASNQLDQSQKVNPASFRLDGTRAISASTWELAPKPLTIEQQISKGDKAKIYVITRAKK